MRTFAPRQKSRQTPRTGSSAMFARIFPGQRRELRQVLHPQHALGQQAVQRFPRPEGDGLETDSTSVEPPASPMRTQSAPPTGIVADYDGSHVRYRTVASRRAERPVRVSRIPPIQRRSSLQADSPESASPTTTSPTRAPFVVHTTPRPMSARPSMRSSLSENLTVELGEFQMQARVLVHPDPSWSPLGGTYPEWRLGYLQTVTDVEDTKYYIVDPRQPALGLSSRSTPLTQGSIFVDRLGALPPFIQDAPMLQDSHTRPFVGHVSYPGSTTFGGTHGYIFQLPEMSDTPGEFAYRGRYADGYNLHLDGFLRRGTFYTYVAAVHSPSRRIFPLYTVNWVMEIEQHHLGADVVRQAFEAWLGDETRVSFPTRERWVRFLIRDFHQFTPADPTPVVSGPVMNQLGRTNRETSWTWRAPRWTS